MVLNLCIGLIFYLKSTEVALFKLTDFVSDASVLPVESFTTTLISTLLIRTILQNIIKKIHKEFLSVYKTKKLNFDSEKKQRLQRIQKRVLTAALKILKTTRTAV